MLHVLYVLCDKVCYCMSSVLLCDWCAIVGQVYYMEVINANRKSPMFPDGVCQQMFLNIKSIYLFHSGFLLDKLENTMKRWLVIMWLVIY